VQVRRLTASDIRALQSSADRARELLDPEERGRQNIAEYAKVTKICGGAAD
jgi:hypothetical protein